MRAVRLLSMLVLLVSRIATAADPPITSLAFSPEGDAVVIGSQGGLEVRSWPEWTRSRTLATSMTAIHDLAFSPRGNVLAVAGGHPAETGIVELFAWPTGDRFHQSEPHEDSVHAIAWRADGNAWATASLDRSAQIHSANGELTRVLKGHSGGVVAVCYLNDGHTLVTGGLDHTLRVWDAMSGEPMRRLDNHTGAVLGLALRPGQPEGTRPMIASIGADRTLRLWQPTIGRMVRLARLESDPQALAWLDDGRAVAVACADGHVRLIDPDTVAILGDQKALEGRLYSLVTIPSGGLLVGGEQGRIGRLGFEKLAPLKPSR